MKAMVEKITCPECGRPGLRIQKRGIGFPQVVPRHFEARVGPAGIYISKHPCRGGSGLPVTIARERNANGEA